MNIDEIRKFLVRANRNGYGNESVKPLGEKDGSHTITYSEPDWLFHDNYFGGEPYGGREVIHFKNVPVWMMVYYGLVLDISIQNEIYTFLYFDLCIVVFSIYFCSCSVSKLSLFRE